MLHRAQPSEDAPLTQPLASPELDAEEDDAMYAPSMPVMEEISEDQLREDEERAAQREQEEAERLRLEAEAKQRAEAAARAKVEKAAAAEKLERERQAAAAAEQKAREEEEARELAEAEEAAQAEAVAAYKPDDATQLVDLDGDATMASADEDSEKQQELQSSELQQPESPAKPAAASKQHFFSEDTTFVPTHTGKKVFGPARPPPGALATPPPKAKAKSSGSLSSFLGSPEVSTPDEVEQEAR